MASTYALPVAPTSHAHGHGRSQSQSHYFTAPSPIRSGRTKALSPVNEGDKATPAHQHQRPNMSGQLYGAVRSPYVEYNANAHNHNHNHGHSHSHSHGHSHSHSHAHTNSNGSTHSLTSFANGRTNGNPPQTPRKNAAAAKYGMFPPVQESAPVPPPSSLLSLPEALTALLLPLPWLFASIAYPSAARKLPSTLSEALVDNEPAIAAKTAASSTHILDVLFLTSTTLLVVGLIARVRSSLDQPLDRRKAESSRGIVAALRDVASLRQTLSNVAGILLPFYATMQIGGAKTALVLVTAIAAGLGATDHRPGKHTRGDDLKRTLRTRRTTLAVLVLGTIIDLAIWGHPVCALLGYGALFTSIFAAPPPLPTAGWSLITGNQSQNSYISKEATRTSLPKPTSPLVKTPEDTLLTCVSGVILMVVTLLSLFLTSSASLFSQHAIIFTALSVASATALVFFSIPAALRSHQYIGLHLSGLMVTTFTGWQSWPEWYHVIFTGLSYILYACGVAWDTRASHAHSHTHDHSHADHSHDHKHEHHLHANPSRISEFLIARTTPGSILHSIMIERDSRRIAYFGVLNLSFMVVQFFYGFVSGSLGLLTDSIHMLFDCAGLAVGLAAAVMSKWRPNARFPYGYGKVDTLSGFANGVFLLLVSVEIIFDAFERLWEGHELQRLNELLIVSILGFLVNIVGLTAFGHAHHGHGHSHDHGDHDHGHGHSHDNENMQGIFLHILADALGSVAVIISTLLTKYYGWSGWDPIASCIIAILIFLSAIPLVKSAGMRLMLSLPTDAEYGVRNTLQELSSLRGVVGYTVPKFWLEDEGAAHAEVHAKEHEHEGCGSGHDHDHDHGHGNDHKHTHSGHDHAHTQSHAHTHDHHDHHDHNHGHDHDHDHDHSHASGKQRILGVIHVIASQAADLEDVRERTIQFLKGRNMDVVVHVEREGDGRCWCGGGNKVS
ncbi:cation efflux family-domain-containing protein [Boeremia exigua]|uniref:cation efflux family-domain-containing protein n=1 Tax=Boeremia exigua TaxID=749465 RepID=UPI001E8E724F|nr:cation efflux family-domain-containing protein [Boeremia exigua]KAH6644000.1 cation efflux family-domain-containing protein [Boeremia exigua]